MTPAPVAAMMAEMLALHGRSVRLLDAGAGVGSLTAAAVDACLRSTTRPRALHVDAWELDAGLAVHLAETLRLATHRAQSMGVTVTSTLHAGDFIESAVARLDGALFQRGAPRYDAAILNPPYRKLRQDEEANQRLHRVGIDVPTSTRPSLCCLQAPEAGRRAGGDRAAELLQRAVFPRLPPSAVVVADAAPGAPVRPPRPRPFETIRCCRRR